MKGRNLFLTAPYQTGDDVRSLQFDLTRFLGSTIPEEEVSQGLFGIGTHKAVVKFQSKHGLIFSKGAAGTVDTTAERIVEAVNRLLKFVVYNEYS